MQPSRAVLGAFGADGPMEPLAGGGGTSWRAGGVVLKPLDTSLADLAWQERVLAPLEGRGDVRVSAPLRSAGDELVVEGWTARRHLPGTTAVGAWAEVARAGRLLCAALDGVPCPDHLAARDDPWALGDRAAWGEAEVPGPLRALAALRRPLHLPAQVVHGDLSGNVLVHPGLPSAVIDLSAYWRPVGFGTAVVVVDALVWHGAGSQLAQELLPGPDDGQLLLRALLFRAVTDALVHSGGSGPGEWGSAAEVVRQLLAARSARGATSVVPR